VADFLAQLSILWTAENHISSQNTVTVPRTKTNY